MGFDMFRAVALSSAASDTPDNYYRELEQAFIDSQWENTTSIKTISEQKIITLYDDYYQDFDFDSVEAWVATVVGQTSTGAKTGRDFLQLIFRDINHPKLEGRYYVIENEYYLSYFDNRVVDVDANLSVRRCNQWMRIIDPLNGAIFQIPAVVDYDMTASSNRISGAIITPNNHATVKVQQNAMTDRLFKTNARFILGGRAFKITGMQNATNQFINNDLASLMEIDLFLDEIWEQDNLIDGVAYNGDYHYVLNINGNDMELTQGISSQLFTKVLLNGEEVNRVVNWETSDDKVITISSDGEYNVIGEVGEEAYITASLYGNNDVFDTIKITIADSTIIQTEVIINPIFTTIREYESISFNVYGLYDGLLVAPDSVELTFNTDVNDYLSYQQNGNNFIFTCKKRSNTLISFSIRIISTSPIYDVTKDFEIKLTSMLG